MKLYAGIDLHSNNNYIGIIDENDKRLYSKRHENDMDTILKCLKPFKEQIEAVVVESTYNWYWLADGLIENGYKLHLANPCAIQQYKGLKHTDDDWDSFWLAHMKRLNILPEGYIFPKEERPIRDLLRRRLLYVSHRTAHILSLQSMITRNCAIRVSGNAIKTLTQDDVCKFFNHPQLEFTANKSVETIKFLSKTIKDIEKEILSQVKLKDEYKLLQTIPGVGIILALTIMLEVGNIERFPTVNDYSSYSRCVKSTRLSNKKKKGENNSKNGNRYLGWAYVEAANFSKRYSTHARRFFQRKASQSNEIVAIKALANKLAKASYFIMRDYVPFDADKLFP